MQITVTVSIDDKQLDALLDRGAAKTAALVQPQLKALSQEIMSMSGTLEAQVQAAAAAIQTSLDAIAADLTALAGQMQPGNQITQADVDALNAVAQAASNAKAQADAMVAPPAP